MLHHLTIPLLQALDLAIEPFALTAFTSLSLLPAALCPFPPDEARSWAGGGSRQGAWVGAGLPPGRHMGELWVHFLLGPHRAGEGEAAGPAGKPSPPRLGQALLLLRLTAQGPSGFRLIWLKSH